MGLFNKNKINVKKEIKSNNIKFFIDYYSLKESNEFKLKLIRELIGENQSLVVIDTNFAYKNGGAIIEEEVNELMKFLDEHSISYRKAIIKNDPNLTILGVSVKLNDAPKVKNYIVGFVVSSEDFGKMGYIVDKFNAYYYVIIDDVDKAELLNKFNETRGDMEKLKTMFEYNIYNDNYVNQIRICSNGKKTEFIEEILQKRC